MFKKYCFILFTLLNVSLWADQTLMQSEIKHVVIVMLENRSFDNVLGWLYDKDNSPSHFIPSHTEPVFKGLTEETLHLYTNILKNSLGEVVFTCNPIKGIPSVACSKILNSPKFDPHEPFPNVTLQIFGNPESTIPTMTGFLQDYATLWTEDEWLDQQTDICAVMETYTEKEFPFIYGLSRHYAISDYWFSSVPTQTNPNRAFSITGTSEGEIINGFLGKNNFQSDTIWNRLSEESPTTTWKIFWQSDLIPVIFPGPYTGPNIFAAMQKIPNLQEHYQYVDAFHELARKGQLPDISYVEPQWTLSKNVSPKEKEILEFILRSQELVLGFQGTDLHPPGDTRAAENFLTNVYTSLISNPDAWKHTLLIITFDEHGGLFDHVPPPPAICPDNYTQNGFDFNRFGVRVPTLFISPLIEKGTIIRSDNSNIPFDHTSVIATLLKWKNIDKSKWRMGLRVDAAPTFENVITRKKPRKDSIIHSQQAVNHQESIVNFGEKFCLRNHKGDYFCIGQPECLHFATVGAPQDKVCLEFIGGSGEVSHGSFTLIQSHDPMLGTANILQTISTFFDCVFAQNNHTCNQWWTIKNLEVPHVGAKVRYGDRIYLENHVYRDLAELLPARLTAIDGFFGQHLTAAPILDEDADEYYWYIEKP